MDLYSIFGAQSDRQAAEAKMEVRARAVAHDRARQRPRVSPATHNLAPRPRGASLACLPRPDLVVFNEGTNDGANDITAAFAAVLDDVLTACPGTPIAVLLPFNGAQRAHLVAAIAACANPSRVHFIDTAGFYNTSFGGGLHPTGPNDVARVAPQIAAQLRPLIAPPPAPAPLEHAPVIAAAKEHKRAADKRSLRASFSSSESRSRSDAE